MKEQSIKKNYIYNTLYQILTLITPFITAPYTSRIFESEGIGIQSYTTSIVSYFTLFAAFGTASYGQREIAMHRDDKKENSKLFWEIELLSCLTTIFATAIWIVLIFMSDKYTSYYAVLTVTLVAVAFDISWFFGGLELFKFIVIRNSIFKILGIMLLFTCVHKKNDLLLFVALNATTGILGNISMWTYLPKFLQKVPVRELRPLRHLKQTLAYFVPTIATSIYTVLDKTMIGAITKSEQENGWYEQASKIVRMTQTLLLSLNTVMSARMSHLFAEKKFDEIKARLIKSFDFLFLLAIPIMAGLCCIAYTFVPWFFGSGYNQVSLLICIMSPLPFVISISNILGSQYLTPSGQRLRSSKGIRR